MRLFTLLLLSGFCMNIAAQSSFQMPTFSYDRSEVEEGTTRYYDKDDLVAEVHKPHKGTIRYFCNRSNAVYDSVYVLYGKKMQEIRFKISGNWGGIYVKKWSEENKIVHHQEFYKDGTLKKDYRGIALLKAYEKQAYGCAENLYFLGDYLEYNEDGTLALRRNYDNGEASGSKLEFSEIGRRKILDLQKTADSIVTAQYGSAFYKAHIRRDFEATTGYYPNSRSYHRNLGFPNAQDRSSGWFMPAQDTITYADFGYAIFLTEESLARSITIRMSQHGYMVDHVDQGDGRKRNMSRGLLEKPTKGKYLSLKAARKKLVKEGYDLPNEGLEIDGVWEANAKSSSTGTFYYRYRFNRFEKKLMGGRLYVYDEILLNPFTGDILADREFKDGVFMEGGYSRKEQRNGLYGFTGEFDPEKPVIPFLYQELPRKLSYTMIAKKDGKYGLITNRNVELLPFEYERLYLIPSKKIRFNKEYVVATKDGKLGLVNLQNETILPFTYDRISKRDEQSVEAQIGQEAPIIYDFRSQSILK